MNGKSVTAWVFVAMMLLMVVPAPQQSVLKDEALVQRVASPSDMVVNFSYTVSGGAEVVDMAYANDHYFVALWTFFIAIVICQKLEFPKNWLKLKRNFVV